MFLDFYRPLVKAGMVYVTLPPLFVVKDGQQRIYCQDESERDAAVARLRATSKRKVEVQRNKGLGEMDADDFWNTVLDPQRRTVIRVHLDDGEAEAAPHSVRRAAGGPAHVDGRHRLPRRHLCSRPRLGEKNCDRHRFPSRIRTWCSTRVPMTTGTTTS